MCNTKPGMRCSTHAYTDLVKAKTAYANLESLIKSKEEKEGDAFANSDAAKRYQEKLLKKAVILDKRQRQYDMTVVAKDDKAIARHYEPPEPEGTKNPDNPKYDKKAWADYYKKREAHGYLKQRYAEVKKWQTGNPKLSAQENKEFKAKYEALEALVQQSRDIGRYLDAIKEGKMNLPPRNADVVAMFDHLKTAEGGRKLTPDEQTVYNHAVELMEAGEEFTPSAKKKREASRFVKAQQDTRAGGRAPDVTALEDWELKTAKEKEAEAERKKAARAAALEKQQRGLTLPPLPPAPVLGQRKDTTPVAPVSGLSSSTGKKLIRVEGADRSGDIRTSPAAPVRPAPTVKPPTVSAPTQVKAPPAPVRPTLLQRLFGRK